MRLLPILLISAIVLFDIAYCAGDRVTTSTCVPGNMCDGTSAKPCSYNKPITVTIELYNGTSYFYGFCVNSDTFYQLSVLDSWNTMNSTNTTYIRVHAGGKVSEVRYYNDATNATYVSFFTAIINLDGGIVTQTNNQSTSAILFQNGCTYGGFGCLLLPDQPCVRSIDCGQTYTANQKAGGNSYLNQNVQLYLAFQGSATGNIPCKSASLLPANFRQYSLQTYFGVLTNLFVPTIN